MTVPIGLAVVLNLQAALQGIARSAGYFNDVKATSVVLDPQALDAMPTTEMPFIVLDVEENGTTVYSGISKPNAIQNHWTIPLLARVDAEGGDTSQKRRAAWQFHADVEKALTVDLQRGGLAQYTYLNWPQFYFGLPSEIEVYVKIPIEIHLQRSYGNP